MKTTPPRVNNEMYRRSVTVEALWVLGRAGRLGIRAPAAT